MTRQPFRALVVDDDAVSRQIVIRALAHIGGRCDVATGGWEAKELLAAENYDVVVTDLRMPCGNGHALCVEILRNSPRPVLVAVTGVIEPRLARDLVSRGVDSVMFKPIDCKRLPDTVGALLDNAGGVGFSGQPSPVNVAHVGPQTSGNALRRISLAELEPRLLSLGHILPVSSAAIEVANMAKADGASVGRIAAAISRDQTLSAELLRVANSPFYNTTGQKLAKIDAAVARIGTKRLGELAMGIAALTGISSSCLSWIDPHLAWRRSVAAGIVSESLLQHAALSDDGEGIVLSALMHELGRVVLGAAYPQVYQQMLALCETTERSLTELEREVFPEHHSSVLARLLEAWNIPAMIYQPLRHLGRSYDEVEQLPEPLRTKVELVKTAVFIGQLAARQWESWNLIELPPVSVIARLDVREIPALLEDAESKSLALESTSRRPAKGTSMQRPENSPPPCQIAYCQIGSTRFDFVKEVLNTVGVHVVAFEPTSATATDEIIINCLGVPARLLAGCFDSISGVKRRLIIADSNRADEYKQFGTVVGLPGSAGSLQKACAGRLGKHHFFSSATAIVAS